MKKIWRLATNKGLVGSRAAVGRELELCRQRVVAVLWGRGLP